MAYRKTGELPKLAPTFADSCASLAQSLVPILDRLVIELDVALHSKKDELPKLFLSWDGDGSKTLSSSELQGGLRSLGLEVSDQEMLVIMKTFDIDGDGEIDYPELADVLLSYQSSASLPTPIAVCRMPINSCCAYHCFAIDRCCAAKSLPPSSRKRLAPKCDTFPRCECYKTARIE